MGFQSVEEQADRQQVGATARAEATNDERSMHRRGSLAPVRLFDTPLSKKPVGLLLGEAQASGAASRRPRRNAGRPISMACGKPAAACA